MPSFEWNPCYITGQASVDEQHHHLVDVINAYGDLLMQAEGVSAAQVDQVFDELARYAQYHFSEEESLMQRHRLDRRHIDEHQAEHRAFIDELARRRQALDSPQGDAAMALHDFMVDWLICHILGVDQRMAHQISAIGAGAAPASAYETDPHAHDPGTATLLAALERLFRRVSERNRELFDFNQALERRVAERTQALLLANAQLEDLSFTDALTGLPNRRFAMRRRQAEWRESQAQGKPMACIMLDADGFKGINDSQGHDAGDQVLVALAQTLQHGLRTDDCVCRLGGDEFLIICGRTPLDGAVRLAEQLRQQVHALRVPAGQGEWQGSISLGVAARDAAMADVEALLKRADQGLYAAKRQGRNCVVAIDAAAAAST